MDEFGRTRGSSRKILNFMHKTGSRASHLRVYKTQEQPTQGSIARED
jgi:hypothetical protein